MARPDTDSATPADVDNRRWGREQPGVPVAEAVAWALARQQLLLVLSNCEHVIDGLRSSATSSRSSNDQVACTFG